MKPHALISLNFAAMSSGLPISGKLPFPPTKRRRVSSASRCVIQPLDERSACTGKCTGIACPKCRFLDPECQTNGRPKLGPQNEPRRQKGLKKPRNNAERTKRLRSLGALKSGAGGGNRTRDSCLEGKGITIMQRPRSLQTSERDGAHPSQRCAPSSMWAGLDLNQRIAFASRIYSPVPLTTRPPTQGGDPLGYAPRTPHSYPRGQGPRGADRGKQGRRRRSLAVDGTGFVNR